MTIITKGKLLKNDHVSIEYQQRDSSDAAPATCTYEQDGAPRKELRVAFKNLAIHGAIAAEFIPVSAVKDINKVDEELIQDYKVTGFTLMKDSEGVIISFQKLLKSGKSLGVNTPAIRFDDESENAYPFTEELEKAIGVCKDELTQYLNGVRAEDPQGKLALQD